jgi:hypothetical protein
LCHEPGNLLEMGDRARIVRPAVDALTNQDRA